MDRQSTDDPALQYGQAAESEKSGAHLPQGFHGFMMARMGHQHVPHSKNRRTTAIPVIGIVLLVMVALHIFAAIFLSKTGSDAFSGNNPLAYGMIGLLLIFAIFKLKHIVGFMRRRAKPSARGIASSTRSVQDD